MDLAKRIHDNPALDRGGYGASPSAAPPATHDPRHTILEEGEDEEGEGRQEVEGKEG